MTQFAHMDDRLRAGARPGARAGAGFSIPELMIAMGITLSLMVIVFTVMRQNQTIFATETGVTAMNENVRAAVDLITREVQSAGTGLRGMTAPILGVDGEGEVGDRFALMIGDPYAPVALVHAPAANTDWVHSLALVAPPGTDGGVNLYYRNGDGKERRLYKPDDLYVLYNEDHFVVVRVVSAERVPSGDVVVKIAPDEANPKPKFGDYAFTPSSDGHDALFARLDTIAYYKWDKEAQTLDRRENHEPWAEVARGIVGFQVRYRVAGDNQPLSEPLEEPPADRTEIRSVVVTIRARTPDAEPGTPHYRETAERMEITPRNMRLPKGSGDDTEPGT